jgi:hypothetical protein
MLTAEEARKITFEAKDEVVKDAIIVLHDRVKSNAKRGIPQADIDIYNKIPFVTSIADGIVQHFENLGYAVTVSEIDNSVKITVSWLLDV